MSRKVKETCIFCRVKVIAANIYGCLYNNAAKIFDVEEVLRRRFVNLTIRKCFKQSESIDYQRPPFE